MSLARGLLGRWRAFGTEHRSIVRGLLAVGFFAFVGKLAGAAKEMAVAWRYGVSAEVDAYLFVLNLVNWPVAIWLSVLTVVLIPLVEKARREPPPVLRRFRAELLALTLLLGIGLALLFHFAIPPLLTAQWLRLPETTAAIAIQMVPTLTWLVVPGLLVGLYSIWTMTSGGHLNTLLEGVPALGILVAVLLSGGIGPLVWGTLIGTVLQLGGLALPMRDRDPVDIPSFSLSSPQWAPFWRGFSLMMLGSAILSLTTIIDQFLAAGLGEGSISAMGYANRILALVLGIVATAVTRSTLPVFSRTAASDEARVRQLAARWSGVLGLVGIAILLIAWILSPFGVRLLFERGTFSATDTATVAHLLRFGLLQLPFYFASLVFVSLVSSEGRYVLLLATGVLGLVTKLVVSYLMLPYYGVGALMLSNAFVYAANLLLLLVAFRLLPMKRSPA